MLELSEEPLLSKVWLKSKQIDLGRLGLNATTEVLAFNHKDPENRFVKYMDSLKSFALAYSMNYGGIQLGNEAAYVIRDLSPMEDLVDSQFNRFKHNQWIQDDIRVGYEKRKNEDIYFADVYFTSKDVNNDRKNIMIYGLEFTNPFRASSAQRIEFWRANVKLISWLDIGSISKTTPIDYAKFKTEPDVEVQMDTKKNAIVNHINGEGMMVKDAGPIYMNPSVYLTTPIFYRQFDILKVRLIMKSDKSSLFEHPDEIKLKGFVVEPVGTTMMG
jgi:hypothetical protein